MDNLYTHMYSAGNYEWAVSLACVSIYRKGSDMNEDRQDTRVLLSMLWVFVVLNTFARDFHELGRPGMLEQVMSGIVDGVVITEELMLLGGLMFEVPIAMVVLCLLLSPPINRMANFIGSGLTIAILAMNNLNPDLDNVFFLVIQLFAIVYIICTSWSWRQSSQV